MTEKTTVTREDNGHLVRVVTYPPNGVSHALQREITELLHQITLDNGEFTLAEVGYLHISTLMYSPKTGSLDLKIYFEASCATRPVKSQVNGHLEPNPVNELNVFSGYLFPGDIHDHISYETINGPKIRTDKDEVNRKSLEIRDKKDYAPINALVIHASFPLVMAAINDADLADPLYKPVATPITRTKHKDIVTTISMDGVPVEVNVTMSDTGYDGYDPTKAEEYLQMISDRFRQKTKSQEKLKEKVRDTAKKKAKAEKTKGQKNLAKYA